MVDWKFQIPWKMSRGADIPGFLVDRGKWSFKKVTYLLKMLMFFLLFYPCFIPMYKVMTLDSRVRLAIVLYR